MTARVGALRVGRGFLIWRTFCVNLVSPLGISFTGSAALFQLWALKALWLVPPNWSAAGIIGLPPGVIVHEMRRHTPCRHKGWFMPEPGI